jgi:hypothetical protein
MIVKEDNDLEHSSCKNTVKMSERHEFSFFKEGAQLPNPRGTVGVSADNIAPERNKG